MIFLIYKKILRNWGDFCGEMDKIENGGGILIKSSDDGDRTEEHRSGSSHSHTTSL